MAPRKIRITRDCLDLVARDASKRALDKCFHGRIKLPPDMLMCEYIGPMESDIDDLNVHSSTPLKFAWKIKNFSEEVLSMTTPQRAIYNCQSIPLPESIRCTLAILCINTIP